MTAAAALCIAMGAVGTTPTASAASSAAKNLPSGRPNPDDAFSSMSRQLRASGASDAHAASSYSGTPNAGACFAYNYSDSSGDVVGNLDIVKYAMTYDCATGRWNATFDFRAGFIDSAFNELDIPLDLDGDTSNNCGGADQGLAAFYVPTQRRVVGFRVGLNSNCDVVPLGTVSYSHAAGSAHVEIGVAASSIGGGKHFQWKARAFSDHYVNNQHLLDFAPNSSNWISASLSNPGTAFNPSRTTGINGSYTQVVPGDFNGDGFSDLLFYAAGKTKDYIWFGNNAGTFSHHAFTINGVYDKIVPGDYNGDHNTDLLFYARGHKPDYVWSFTSGSHYVSHAFPINGSYTDIVPGDFNGDGHSDLLFYVAGRGKDFVWLADSNNPKLHFTSSPTRINGTYQIVSGHFGGQPATDLFLYGLGTAPDFIWTPTGTGTTFVSTPRPVNASYAHLLVGDYNGDTYDDILLFQPGTKGDTLLRGGAGSPALTPNPTPVSVNEQYDGAVSGDFNGDGRGDILFYFVGARPESIWLGL